MFEREENPSNVTSAQIVVGIPSYSEADSISFPTQQAARGLRKYFPDKTSVIINGDNDSQDGTEVVFFDTPTDVPKIYIATPPHAQGKGYNLENMLRKSLELGAKCFICIDADLTSITPEWIKYFAEPILDGYDYNTPLYSRHKYDGTITNNICFPLIYGLFCQNIRQPIGGDFALSRPLIEYLICQPWHRTTDEYGIDIFMSMNAIAGGFKTCKTRLGAKHHKPSLPKLGSMFSQVVSSAFLMVTRNFHQWRLLKNIEHPPIFGMKDLEPPQDLNIDRCYFEQQAREEFHRHKKLLKEILPGEKFYTVDRLFSDGFSGFTGEDWSAIVYDMIAAFSKAEDKVSIVESLKALYFGRTLSFMNKTWEWSTKKAEEEIQSQAEAFYKNRDYLIQKLEP